MKIKNNSLRNVSLMGLHNGGVPPRLMIPAETTVEFTEREYAPVARSAEPLLNLGILSFVVSPVSLMTVAEIADKVLFEKDVELKTKGKTKAEVQEKAEALGVSV
jgi:hypothetical protein